MSRKPSKPKKVSYALIAKDSDVGRRLYTMLQELIVAHHEDLGEARIALAWNTAWKPDVDGRVTLGQCKKASDLDRELAAFDFVILLRRDFLESPSVTALQRRALIDHELMHAAVKYDSSGEPAIDERGRPVYRIRKHDIEEFTAIVDRYGCWKHDLESFAQALDRAASTTTQLGYIGYQRVHALLRAIGMSVPLEVVVTWSDAERREVHAWAVLRQELAQTPGFFADATEVSMPACVAAVATPA